jgi:methionyl-tRNA formyltransferase
VKVVVLAPIDNSPFALSVAELCHREPGIEVAAVVVRRILDWNRLRGELRRDGVRLVRKAWRKLVLRAAAQAAEGERSFYDIVDELGLGERSLARWARARGVELLEVRDHNAPEAIALLERVAPEVVAFTGGGLVRRGLLQVSGRGIFNTHMGILPPYRGMDVVEWPLVEERHESIGLGVTLHFMDPGVDTGPILAVHPVPIRRGDGMERLRTRFEPVMVEAMLEGVRAARDGGLEPRAQALEEGRQYFVLHPRLYELARTRLATAAGNVGPPPARPEAHSTM